MTPSEKQNAAPEDWIAVQLQIAPQVLEKISAALFALGAEGIQEENAAFTVYFAASNWNAETYLLLKQILDEASSAFTEDRLRLSSFATQDWNAAWKRYFKPFRVSNYLVVCPPWEDYAPEAGEKVIIINPKMAFGTGHHESTRLALELMEKYYSPPQSFLDIGTGSGILAIYAARLGATKISATDVDDAALENAAENSRLNKVERVTRYFSGGLEAVPAEPYDVIAANINRRVLMEMVDDISPYAGAGSYLILSGLLIGDGPDVEERFRRRGWRLKERRRMNEWQALVMVYGQ